MKLRDFYKNLTFGNNDNSDILGSLKNFTYLTSDDIQLSSNIFYDCTETPISSVTLKISENEINQINNSICLFKTASLDHINYDIDVDSVLFNTELSSLSFDSNTNYLIEIKDNMIFLNKLSKSNRYLTQALTFKALTNNSSISFEVVSGTVDISGIKFNKNNTGWQSLNGTIHLDENDTVAFRNTKNTLNIDEENYAQFEMTGLIEADGNVQSLLNFSDSCQIYCFYNLFYNCSSLITVPQLPAEYMAERCYHHMFDGCTSLSTISLELKSNHLKPSCYQSMFANCSDLISGINELPATTLADLCYKNMFFGCSSLIVAPELPATKLTEQCYYQMFTYCSSLIVAPELPATKLKEQCYKSMFRGCTSLATAPGLPATKLANYCYSQMFANCTSLTQISELPATTLADYCYSYMFKDCTSLTTAPELPATELVNYCYSQMFENCSSLIIAPELPAATLADSCYFNMFRYCTSLVNGPSVLSAMNLYDSCYMSMFFGCSSLIEAPELPAIELVSNCYRSMFNGCTSLTQAPELPATSLADNCYYNMFNNCSHLSSITVEFTEWTSTNAFLNWVNGIAPNGRFTCPANLSAEFGSNRIPYGWETPNYEISYIPLTFTATIDGSSVTLKKGKGSPTVGGLKYRTSIYDNFETYPISTKIDLHENEYVQFINTNSTLSKGTSDYAQFMAEGSINGSGNIQSLLNYSNSVPNYGFYSLLSGCTSLKTAPELPATTLGRSCYHNMFDSCSSLEKGPTLLPATALISSCYNNMFHNCSKLTDAPYLSASSTDYRSSYCMFYGCSLLSGVQTILPATTLATECYMSMFYGCSSLEKAPKLPAPILTTNCYRSMFRNCSKLNSIEVGFTDWNESLSATLYWVTGVSTSNGNFICPSNLNVEYGPNRIPNNWSINE